MWPGTAGHPARRNGAPRTPGCRALRNEAFAVGGPGVVAEPAEGLEAAAEAARDLGREPGVSVIEAALEEVEFAGAVKSEELKPAFAGETLRRL